ncbi:MAG: glycogen-binding domain-containing protein, partial [Candidatus Poseidoniaceae archaeon]|nr:glycogen-binding domain-containing protein [Candidatus Poseidoniaceae archaeon]
MKQQICIAALFLTVLLLPMIPASADEPIIDYSSGNTVFTYSDSATTVELAGEWDWDNPVTLSESSGVWTAEVALNEGIYCYKFIVDGEYVFDPSNPYRGYCGDVENSVVRIKDSARPNFASELINDQLVITFLPGTSGAEPDGTPAGLEAATWDSA